jgi:hypothetical protein
MSRIQEMMNIEVSSADAASIWEALTSAAEPLECDVICRQTGISAVRVNSMLGKFLMAGLVERRQPTADQIQAAAEKSEEQSRQARRRAAARDVKTLRQPPPQITATPGFVANKSLDSMAYATAVEIGIPLFLLERTVSLSKQARRQAFHLAESGQVDAIREAADKRRQKEARATLRGRAASRAAATDLARLVHDVSRVAPVTAPLAREFSQLFASVPSADRAPNGAARVISEQPVETPALAKVREEVSRQAAQALEALVNALERR